MQSPPTELTPAAPAPSAAELLAGELAALSHGDPLRAAVHLSAQHQHSPHDPEVCAALGLAFAATGETAAALRVLERAHLLAPGEARYLYLHGLALEADGRPDDAALRYEAARRLAPDHAGARARLAAQPEPAPPLVSLATAPPARPRPTPAPRQAPPRLPAPLPDRVPTPDRRPPAADLRSPGDLAGSLPGFGGLLKGVLLLWFANPLLWLLLLALPNALAVAASPREAEFAGEAVVIWIAAFGLGAALVLSAMTSQWLTGRRGGVSALGLGGVILLAVPYLLLALAPWSVLLALQVPALPLVATLLVTLLLTAPFHALFAPALALATRGERPGGALAAAFRLAGRRTWLHLALFLTAGLLVGGAGAVTAWSFLASMHGGGELVEGLLQVAGLSLGQSLWAALITVCGHDAVAAAPRGRLGPLAPDADL